MSGWMRGASSLTEAVKQAASEGQSLTDAVKEAAMSGDATVVSFPQPAPELRRDWAPFIRLVKSDAPDAGGAKQAPIREAPRHQAALVQPDEADVPMAGPAEEAGDYAEPASRPVRTARFYWHAPAPTPPVAAAKPLQPKPLQTKPLRPKRPAVARRASPAGTALRRLALAARQAALRLAGALVLLVLSLVAGPSPAGSDRPLLVAAGGERRVALVIGNSAYRSTRKLDNPTNDAADVGAALKRLGFDVIAGHDLDKSALDAKIREFATALRGARVGVFFYAGHGLNVSGQNYLVPVDAQLTAASAPDIELVRLDLVHRAMERESPTNILFFDACRDSPLSDSLARAMGTRSAEVGRGLAVVQGGAGTLISFSTQPGTVALDGKGRNSPYSAALVRQLTTSHEDLSAMLIAIRNDVMKETDLRQVPWEHSALTGRFYFNSAPEARTAQPPAEGTADVRAREAFDAWSAAKDTRSVAVLDAFIARYGDTFYAELARARIAEVRKLERAFSEQRP